MSEVQPGDILAGKYRVERVLGEGGMGIVVAATHLALEERVAIKFMRAGGAPGDDATLRFLREARAAVKLKSEHVARVSDVGTLETGSPYIVMEYLEGTDLSELLTQRGKLTLGEAVEFLLQACDAIAEAHSRGIIHRDLKPANLFITRGRDGAPLLKVLDFGISKVNALGDRPESLTQSTAILGSPMYMSPEQMKSSRDVAPTTDIWSLGVILYEAVGGRVPFDEETMGALMAKVLTQAPPALHTLRGDLPEPFVSVVARCLEKEPSLRYGSVAELARALAPFADTSVEERVARIEALSGGAGGASGASLVPQPGRSGGDLGVAATLPLTASSWSATGAGSPKRGIGGRVALAVGAFVVVAGAAGFGAWMVSHKAPVATAPPVEPPTASPPATSAAAAAPPPTGGATSGPVDTASPASSPATSATPPPTPAVALPRHTAHLQPPPTAKTAAPAADPFGKSRQ